MKHLAAVRRELDFSGPPGTAKRLGTAWMAVAAVGGMLMAVLAMGAYTHVAHSPARGLQAALYGANAGEPMSPATPGAPPSASLSAPAVEMGAYILQLGSFNTFASTIRAVDIFTQKGIQAHWNAVNMNAKGIWYRVYAGRYPTHQAARGYQKTMALGSSKVLFAPWTLSLGRSDARDGDGDMETLLRTHGLDSYTAIGDDGRQYLFSGAYVSRKDATAMAEQIFKRTGLEVDIQSFHQPLLPRKSSAQKKTDGKSS